MKKKLFFYFIITLFIFFILAYAFTTIENYFVKSTDIIIEDFDEKEIIVFEEVVEDGICHGKYLMNNGSIYSYSYNYTEELELNDRIDQMKKHTESKLDKMKKKDKGFLSMYIVKLKDSYFKRTTKSDRPTKVIYYIDYKKNQTKIIISSGELVMKNKSFSGSRVVSILKKYSIRVD